jgi:ATP-binding cassette subfamily B protein
LDVGLVTGDPAALQDVVWDLLAHAVRSSKPEARIAIALERAGNEVVLRVTDEGRAAEQPPETGSTPARRFDVALLRAVLEEHHGRLTVEHDAAGGNTYVAALPVRAVAAPADNASAKALPGAEVLSLSGRSVLVVDDDEDARETLSQLLATHDAAVESFESGRSVLEHLRTRSRKEWPDLLICDIGLPDEDGYTVLRRVRAFEAEHRVPLRERMPAIALTGYAQEEDRRNALIAGFQAHLVKPALPQELFASIARLIGASYRPQTAR